MNESDSKYQIIITKEQLKLIARALDQWGRLHIGQCSYLVDELSYDGHPKNTIFSDEKERDYYILRKHTAWRLMQLALEIAMPDTQGQHDDDSKLAFDLMRFIKHRLYIDDGGKPDDYSVWSRTPDMLFTGGIEPQIKRIEIKDHKK